MTEHDAALLKHPEILDKIKKASSDPDGWVDIRLFGDLGGFVASRLSSPTDEP